MVSAFSRRIKKARTKYEYKKKRVYTSKALTPTIGRSLMPAGKKVFPDYYTTTLKYCEMINLDVGIATTAVSYVYRANSLFDPNYTGTGHQPMGFDDLSRIYNKYSVIKAHMKVRFAMTGNQGTTGCCQATVRTSRNDGIQTNWETIREADNCKETIVTFANNPVLDCYWNSNQLSQTQRDALTAQSASNPSNPDFFIISALWTGDQNIDPAILRCQVTIWYTAKFDEREDMTGS